MDESEDKFKKQVELGKRIKQIRKSAGLNQKDFAQILGVCNSYISFIERGLKGSNFDIFYKLALGFNVSMDYLFFGIEPMKLTKKINPEKDDRNNVDAIATPKDILWFMDHSTLFRDTMMSYAAKFHLDNVEIIGRNIQNTRKIKIQGGEEKNENENEEQ
jgi:transcriptional regulator with XRE-family HTH domain